MVVTAYVFIMVKPGARLDVSPETLMKITGVKDVTEVYGENDVIVKVQVPQLKDLQTMIKKLRESGGIEKTTTMIGMV
jgi:DNA-binding Lrp family transcriptional regulator